MVLLLHRIVLKLSLCLNTGTSIKEDSSDYQVLSTLSRLLKCAEVPKYFAPCLNDILLRGNS